MSESECGFFFSCYQNLVIYIYIYYIIMLYICTTHKYYIKYLISSKTQFVIQIICNEYL